MKHFLIFALGVVYLICPNAEGRKHKKLAEVVESETSGGWPKLPMSDLGLRMQNPILQWAFDGPKLPHNASLQLIILSVGDPTLNRNGRMVNNESVDALHTSINNHSWDGYNNANGIQIARQAIADEVNVSYVNFTHVIMTLGGSQALTLAVDALSNPGDAILIPGPGFPYYKHDIFAWSQITPQMYKIDLEKREIDLESVEKAITPKTKAILVNNPHNPTGISFPKENLEGLLSIADKHKIPIIGDEIYQKIVFDGEWQSMAKLEPKVPMIICDGLSKRVHVPGWRIGWMVFYDPFNTMVDVKKGVEGMTYHILGTPSIIQGAFPEILANTTEAYYQEIRNQLKENVDASYGILSEVKGLTVYKPHAAMHMLIKLNTDIIGEQWKNDTKFCIELICRQSLILFPGKSFDAPGHVRIFIASSRNATIEGSNRLKNFVNDLAEKKEHGEEYKECNPHGETDDTLEIPQIDPGNYPHFVLRN